MKLSLDEVRGLMEAFSSSGLTSFSLKDGDFELSLSSEKPEQVYVCPPAAPAGVPAPAAAPAAQPSAPAAKEEEISGNVVKSPIVGTFYASAAPDKPPYVTVGKTVQEGDVLFIIESMKLMNEVTSEFNGTVEKILVQNGQAVEYGQPIMVIR
ncbi:MAG TPA: acetyl-CoA carboxylase biotin carboxyl carrier protein [Candidatus Faecivivens stercoripullorum]|uniref:Biotin carboxyl carrier protein of acetyl-CoA carboxylase n=1 Tax=Candidatus Faecivivens stercoripullorum TaxID=2840805 RepID=A0A9D1H5X0_9FIRM|nr:acetyl-CoA carboxylase biotin carboxyl carrier protein [Candidatus Faecivivens stercoripullorum]